MYCKNCGKQIAEGLRFCPECGKETGAPAASVSGQPYVSKMAPPKDVRSKEERYKKRCPKCESENITMDTVVETKKRGIIKIILYLLLVLIALIVCCIPIPGLRLVGIVMLLIVIIFAFRRKTKTVTYAVCQNCGKRWKVR